MFQRVLIYLDFAELKRNIRFYVLITTISLSIAVYLWITATVESPAVRTIRFTQSYALLAVTYLYFALLATPFTRAFTGFPYRAQYLKARRAIGVSSFYFMILHVNNAFFGQLGGFEGLGFLGDRYLQAIALGAFSLTIIALMAATAFDSVVDKLSYPKWKILHRLVYLAAISIVIHALMLGSHFSNLSDTIPVIFFVALVFLLVLEAMRVYDYLKGKFGSKSR